MTNRIHDQDLPDVAEFLKEYEALTKKYGFCINSCECCNSPWVDKYRDDMYFPLRPDDHIRHLKYEAGLDVPNIDL